MNNPVDIPIRQYEFLKDSRKVLLNYCESMKTADFTMESPHFGRGGSIRNLLVHIVNAYQFWIGSVALKKLDKIILYDQITEIKDCRIMFKKIDLSMKIFFDKMSLTSEDEIVFELNGKMAKASFLKLFTHVFTHEFHHKGQILSIARQLGHTPVDTDILR